MSQLASRMAGESRARLTMLRLLCAVSIWRTAMTQVLPLCGAAAWWVTLICMLPGFAVAVLLRLAMRLSCTSTLPEAIRACLGKAGAWGIALLLMGLLLVEGLSGLTALITLFTDGVGTRGTAFTLALLTGGALAFCLHREGLPRGVHFLRWPMAVAAVLLAACLLPSARLDHLYPLYGEDENTVRAALQAGISMAWPLTLLLTLPSSRAGRLRGAVLPGILAVGAMLLLTLMLTQELLSGQRGLAEWLLLPTKYAVNALRILYLCLLMLTNFLSIGASVQLASQQLCAPLERRSKWLPGLLLTGLVLSQTGDPAILWQGLSAAQKWLLLPMMGIAGACLPIALIRGRKS